MYVYTKTKLSSTWSVNTKGRNSQNSHTVEYFKNIFSVIVRTSRHNIGIIIEDLNYSID